MNSKRQLQYASIFLKELSHIFQVDAKHQFGTAFITITKVDVSPDLSIAKVYLSFLMVPDKEAMLELIREKTKSIRQLLGNKIRNQARIVPSLIFFLDDSADYAIKMEKMIQDLNIPKE